MNLELIIKTPAVSAYYDRANDWLYLDWSGVLSLHDVQNGCLAVAKCFLERSYTRILNDNSNVTHVAPDVANWLATAYLPHMTLAGIQHIAWVYAPDLDAQCYVEIALYTHAMPVVALFNDVASACTWLAQAHLICAVPSAVAPRSAAENQTELRARLAQVDNPMRPAAGIHAEPEAEHVLVPELVGAVAAR
ncbi:MAG TPA: hypothetical protein VF630_09295 [Hymenobacter sp.]|jgi:hypothetical protein